MVKLRLKRYGKKQQPSYRIIAIESKTRREARPLEELGYYNPRTKETVLETGSLLKWLRCGAQPTDTLQGILKKAGIYNMLEAGEGGVVASIRIPAMAKPEVGIPEVAEEPAVATAEAEAAELVAEVAAVAEPETAQPEEGEPVVAEVETPAEPKVEEAAEA
ncbi:30S ribosomal protein S16 [Synechococcus sp. Nb3U1]|uniref:30S ribosomal protein S16 n=1 Tax=Synechococcus sp. Nb3U1 TaxID=1914529 RepID=UPI001F2C04B6|nr:30S ribosomal protein S16 [Synechococcus sp. Nb3U1]MCF2969861.1 30S ribosomal protein S16 [Synechococcus sp. Nb3U1]